LNLHQPAVSCLEGNRATIATEYSSGPSLAQSDHKLAHTFNIAYIAHAPLEPRAAVAEQLRRLVDSVALRRAESGCAIPRFALAAAAGVPIARSRRPPITSRAK